MLNSALVCSVAGNSGNCRRTSDVSGARPSRGRRSSSTACRWPVLPGTCQSVAVRSPCRSVIFLHSSNIPQYVPHSGTVLSPPPIRIAPSHKALFQCCTYGACCVFLIIVLISWFSGKSLKSLSTYVGYKAKCTKFDFGWGSNLNLAAGGAYSAPTNSPAGF